MNRYGMFEHTRDDDGSQGPHNVHAEGVGLIGSATLCGDTDTVGYMNWIDTDKPVTCGGCLAVIAHVHENYPRRRKGASA